MTSSIRETMRAELGDAYVIERELDGGMSCVFVAEDRDLSRRVVIKVLHPHLAASVSIERFRREILTVAALQHPHIVGVLRTGTADGLPYFIMPYVDGESLAQRLTAGRFSVRDTVAVLKDVARALAFAHDRGVVHRDIKPANILLAGGSAMVTDFGVAKALSSARRTAPTAASGLTTDGTSIGTLLYMAPEQAAADPDIDGRADIYSLGATAYEMLTGAPPFAGLPARAMLAARMSMLPPAISTVRDDVPVDLNDLILSCLATDPVDRPHTAQDLVDALERPSVVSGEFAKIPRPRSRHMFAGISAGFALLAIIGAGLATSRNNPQISAASRAAAAIAAPLGEIAVVPFVDLGSDSADANVAIGITNAVADNLTRSAHLKVISPTASAALVRQIRSGTPRVTKSAPQLLLEGTVQREGSKLRVTARLSNASDGVMRWADVYDRDGHDLFKVTDDIAAAIVASLNHPAA